LNSNYLSKIEKATKNIEGKVFDRVRELGQRARMAKLITILVEKLEENEFTFSRSKDNKVLYMGVDLGDDFKKLSIDPENHYIFSNEIEHILRESIKISCSDKLGSINEYIEEQIQEEILPGITLGMLIEEELLIDI